MTLQLNPLTHLSSDRVLLSFDDGPRPGLTPRLLDTLARFGAGALFFIYGRRGAGQRDLLRRIVAEGHELGNHTWTHLRLTKAADADVFQEIKRTQELIEDIAGRPARFFRPPYGKMSPEMVEMALEKFNLRTMMWSLDPSDWSSPGVGVICDRVAGAARGGDIVLLHERKQTAEALPDILSSLRRRNLQTLTINAPELL